jgi:dihydropteroate synthase-like protein
MSTEKIHFVTGRLAESALRKTVGQVAAKVGFEYSIQVLPITVAALLTPSWIAPRLDIPVGTTRIILPGYSEGDLTPILERTQVPVEFGPQDLRKLPAFFGHQPSPPDLAEFDIQIIAEINHAPRKSLQEILAMARQMKQDGADLIDVGCEPNSCWGGAGQCVAALVAEGHRVSIDSLNPVEISSAVQAGAELVLSVNSSNREFAPDWGCEVVVIPDDVADLNSLEPTSDYLRDHRVPYRIDPILEPIGFGFANSLRRYLQARESWPDVEMMMGIGNLTELTDVDSAGVNLLLLAVCQELGIRSVLTTEVINWARSSIKECDIGRRLVYHSIHNRVPPKHLSEDLVQLRDAEVLEFGVAQVDELSRLIKDNNYRLFAERGEIHLLGSGLHLHAPDPFEIFDRLAATEPGNLNASHAFYLGYEMCKAMTALRLGKQYTQDEALAWGHLTVPETNRHRLEKFRRGDKT